MGKQKVFGEPFNVRKISQKKGEQILKHQGGALVRISAILPGLIMQVQDEIYSIDFPQTVPNIVDELQNGHDKVVKLMIRASDALNIGLPTLRKELGKFTSSEMDLGTIESSTLETMIAQINANGTICLVLAQKQGMNDSQK